MRTSLTHSEAHVLQTSDLDAESRSLLGVNKKLLILRPDGYIGFRGPIEKRACWLDYARQDVLTA